MFTQASITRDHKNIIAKPIGFLNSVVRVPAILKNVKVVSHLGCQSCSAKLKTPKLRSVLPSGPIIKNCDRNDCGRRRELLHKLLPLQSQFVDKLKCTRPQAKLTNRTR